MENRAGADALRLTADDRRHRPAERARIAVGLDREFQSAQARQRNAGEQCAAGCSPSTRQLSGISSMKKLPTAHEYHLRGCMALCAAGLIVSGILILVVAYEIRADWSSELQPVGYAGNVKRGER